MSKPSNHSSTEEFTQQATPSDADDGTADSSKYAQSAIQTARVSPSEARLDIHGMLWSMRLEYIHRYFHQRFWEKETNDAEYAQLIEPFPRLETVAEHSWHVADTVLIIGARFPHLDINRCLTLAILHDKLEVLTGDQNPVGRDGTGTKTHAFNEKEREQKIDAERDILPLYFSKIPPSVAKQQEPILRELHESVTQEALFVKAIDKLQALAYIYEKKKGRFSDKHLLFTRRYSYKAVEYFPGILPHHQELWGRLLKRVAKYRRTTVEELIEGLFGRQLDLFPPDQP